MKRFPMGVVPFLSPLGWSTAPFPAPHHFPGQEKCTPLASVPAAFTSPKNFLFLAGSGIARLRGSREIVNPVEWHRGHGLSHRNTFVLFVL